MTTDIVGVSDMMREDFAGSPVADPFQTMIGEIWPGMSILVWGPKGHGKSTFCLILAAQLTGHAMLMDGTVWYISGEEGVGPGIQKRVQRVGIDAERFGDDLRVSGYEPQPLSDLKRQITDHKARWLIVDSVPTLGLDTSEIWSLLKWAKELDPPTGVVLVAHAYKDGTDYKGDSALGHWVDVELRIYRDDTGRHLAETRKSRSLDRYPDPTPTPATVRDLRGNPSIGDVLYRYRENGMCENWPQKSKSIQKRCKWIFANLGRPDDDTGGDADDADADDTGADDTPDRDEVTPEPADETGDSAEGVDEDESEEDESTDESTSESTSETDEDLQDLSMGQLFGKLENIMSGI